MKKLSSTTVLLTTVVLLVGCGGLSAADCESALPVELDELTLGKAESGNPTCEGSIESIPVVVEMENQDDRWRMIQAWVDGDLTSASGLEEEIAQEQLQRAAEELGNEAVEALGKAGEAVKGFLDDLEN